LLGLSTEFILPKMPQLRIVTNVPKDEIPENFLAEVTTIFQAAINKPMKVQAWIFCLSNS